MAKLPSSSARREFRCPACGKDSWLVRKPRYDDAFERVGETLSCAVCRHEFASEAEIPFKDDRKPRVFTDADRPRPVKVFEAGETDRMCSRCSQYVVNPFWQRCGLHRCEVEATDTCPHFEPRA